MRSHEAKEDGDGETRVREAEDGAIEADSSQRSTRKRMERNGERVLFFSLDPRRKEE